MSELLPTVQAENIRTSLLDYLTTTFALADEDARLALLDFLSDPDHGIFKGPYLCTRLPFRPASEGWRDTLDWYEGPTPYGHQAAAFARLSTLNQPRPRPTVITTGTGSGKTEAFLYPILDHVLRVKRRGVTGTKALILYPMNALANDQAQRLATLITSHAEVAGVTAALYTGQQGPERTKVTVDGLITDRAVIRSSAPDILLTNYKMLDQMLLRSADAELWRQSAHSLQYLVLDEFHTYDGAQGTDVSMLLRRLGMALKSHWSAEDPDVNPADRERPLGRLTPVATSATLGDQGDPAAMQSFARTVFGEDIPDDGLITEARMPLAEWTHGAADRVTAAGLAPDADPGVVESVVSTFRALGPDAEPAEVAAAVLDELYARPGASAAVEPLDLVRAHPVLQAVLAHSEEAIDLSDLAGRLWPTSRRPESLDSVVEFLLACLAAMSHVRAVAGRAAPSVDLHLWVRELTRLDRVATVAPRYRWSDEGDVANEQADLGEGSRSFPAVYCRNCGRSGWGVVLAPVGSDLDSNDDTIRARHLAQDDRFRPLIFAPADAGAGPMAEDGQLSNLRWLDVRGRQLLNRPDDEAAYRSGAVLPVLTHVGEDAGALSRTDTCPSCDAKDGIRFLGSAIATLLSVSLSTLFSSAVLDQREKKALVFTDSVQDAAHRAGFVQSRSHSLTLRALLRDAVGDQPVMLDDLVQQVIGRAGNDPHRRYRILPPDLADRDTFVAFWQRSTLSKVPAAVRARVRRRLALDAVLEFGLQSRVGRTLELTGSVAAQVEAAPGVMASVAAQVIDEALDQRVLDGFAAPDAVTRIAWVRGVLERMRLRGAVDHEWFHSYQSEDGRRYSIWGGRPRGDGMPSFPRERAAPGYPRVGGRGARDSDLDPVTGSQSWYAQWTSRILQVGRADAGPLAKVLLQRLAKAGVLEAVNTDSGAQLFRIAPSSVLVAPVALADLQEGRALLTCDVCQAKVPGTPAVVEQLNGAPCLTVRCSGRLERSAGRDNFYRAMYSSSSMERVVAREHTGLLDDTLRTELENGFKARERDPQAPNVLVATPTLEMGIDIGDLSTVVLASLPRSVASYLQRVGRAGRLTGSALNLAFVSGRGEQLPRLGDPLSMINGQVRPPATYVDAEEILRRQYLASVMDRLARRPDAPHPRRANEAIGATGPGGFLAAVVEEAEAAEPLEVFLAGFDTLRKEARDNLAQWAAPLDALPGTSLLAARVYEASARWAATVQSLELRAPEIQASLPELEQLAASPAATDDDRAAARTALAGLRLTKRQLVALRGEYWIQVLEEYGLLPNYTLIDDSVTLDVALSWVDPDSGEYRSEPHSYTRGSALALREFAPGSAFYANGHKITIDAVDLGHHGDAVRSWTFCPACGFGADITDTAGPDACPRCGSAGVADVAQHLDLVELERVSAALRREEAVIDDVRDERERQQFTTVLAADVDQVGAQWFVTDYDFGIRHLRRLTLRWLNLGRAATHGATRIIAGNQVTAPLFRVCSSCGQLDTMTHRNRHTEHRPWCPQRRAADESTRTVALSRTLATEGLVIRVPTSISLGDRYALPSLQAAVLLGLRERIGGDPDHLAITPIQEPGAGGESREALLLHDVVPGGTGYLADLADPETFHSVLYRAWEVVRHCPCQHEDRACCHRCLLPFADSRSHRLVSRVAAERHLRAILVAGETGGEPEDVVTWHLTETPPPAFDPETHIEQRFRHTVIRLLEGLGASVVEQPGAAGNRLVINLGGGRTWTLDPQENLLDSKPDFVLRSDDPAVPLMAIFCDGWRFHASPAVNRIADDARKRQNLRDAGHLVLAVTWQDLDDFESGTVRTPPWLNEQHVAPLMAQANGALSSAMVDAARRGSIELLGQWLQAPKPASVRAFAEWLPMFVAGSSTLGWTSPTANLARVADAALAGAAPVDDGERRTWTWTGGSVAFAGRHLGPAVSDTEAALVLDDFPTRLGEVYAGGWRDWLRLSNLLNLRTRPLVITARSLLPTTAEPGVVAAGPDAATVPSDWRDVYELAGPAERSLLQQIATLGLPRPELGVEVGDGIPLTISWPALRVVLDVDLEEEDRRDLSTDHWVVVPFDTEQLAERLARAAAARGGVG